jgi:hypothetical protein
MQDQTGVYRMRCTVGKARNLWWCVLGWVLWLVVLVLPVVPQAHQSGCHRWHSCPSDRGIYVCGDLGYCAQCPDNAYGTGGQPRQVTQTPAPVPPREQVAPQQPSAPVVPVRETFTGKVVGLSDGDTLSVLREGKAVKLRITAA